MTSPTLLFLGHAGLLIQHAGTSLLCDPWLSDSGAFLHAWHQFPPNAFVREQFGDALREADYLYLSHEHADHFDRDFLESIPDKQRITVLIADFLGKAFQRSLAGLGFSQVVALDDWEPFRLAEGFSVRIIKEPSGFKMDSALLAQAGSRLILDRNDCHLSDPDRAQLRELGVDLMLAQFSGAMWYPAAYVYPREKQHALSASLRKNLLDRFCARVNGVRPRHVIHAAGPPCFLEPDSFHLNFQENSIFYDQSDVFEDLQARLEARLHLVLPGDTLEWGPSGDLTMHRLQDFDFSRKREALAAYEESRRGSIEAYLAGLPQPAPGFLREFMRHIAQLAGSSRLLRERADGLIRFHISGEHGGRVELDTCDGRFHLSTQPSAAGATYEFELDGRVARQLVEGRETWESVLLSMRFRARRDPDTYNWPLFALLRYGHDPVLIRRIEQRMGSAPPETLTVQDGRDRYLIGRYCPHTGEDLAGAQICDGRLTCPRHHWVFDLREGGRCVAGGNISLARCELVQGGDPAPVRSGPVALQDDEQDD